MKQTENKTKKLHMQICCESLYHDSINVPKQMDLKEAFLHAAGHLDEASSKNALFDPENRIIAFCPYCGYEGLVHGAKETLDDGFAYPWRCPQCNASGKEIYTFSLKEPIEEKQEEES